MLRKAVALSVVLAMLALCGAAQAQPKNVFVMISDGASFGAWDAGDLYQNGATCTSSYYGAEFSKYLMTTYPLNTSQTPTGGNVQEVSYDAAQAWSIGAYNTPGGYLHQNWTDSAAAATAMATGQKTYNNAINWGNDPAVTGTAILPTLPELSKAMGKAVGTITTVEWNHATPAGFSNAHNISRNDYAALGQAMLADNVMDVIMGAGNPQYNDNGVQTIAAYNDPAITNSKAKYVGGRDAWIQLNEGTHAGGWTLIQEKAEFEAIANGTYAGDLASLRLVGTAQAATTTQQGRSGYAVTDTPGSDPLNANVPSLATMTNAALNVLNARSSGNGIFLQIEGGAIDWAAHANQTSRLVEEQADFNDAVDAVIAWIEANGGWEDSLLIITTDHGNSMPMGPDSNSVAHDRIELGDLANGQYKAGENEQGVRWWSGNHTNELVPLFVRGAGSEVFAGLVDGTDSSFAQFYADWAATGFDGRYIDNTDVFHGAVAAMNVPEPATMGLLAIGGLALVRRRK